MGHGTRMAAGEEDRSAEAAPRLGITAGARYRTVPQAQIVELLALQGWAYRLREIGREAVLVEVRAALDGCVDAGLAFAVGPAGERRFDPAEVMNWIKWAWIHKGNPLWRDRFAETGRALVHEFHAARRDESHATRDSNGLPPPPAALAPQRFSVTLERSFNLRGKRGGHAAGKPIHLRLPLPLEGPALRGLEIARQRSSAGETQFVVGPGRLDGRLLAPPEGEVTLGADFTFIGYPTVPMPDATALTADEVELYTRPSEGLIQIDTRIRDLASELGGRVHDPWDLVERFWRFLHDELTCGVLHYDDLGAYPLAWVLASGWYDCQLGSALLIALCRARGLPARMASGYLLHSANPANHYWMEVWIEGRGWVPLDLFCAGFWDRTHAAAWRNYFLGTLDYRMQTQQLPRLFTGSPALRFPPSWYWLMRSLEDGIEIGFFETDSGAPIYRDRISVRRV